MPRLRQVPLDEAHDAARGIYRALFGGRDPVAEPGTATGTPGNWWTVFAAVPDCFDHAVQGFAFYRSPKRKLDPKLRELAQSRAGYSRGSQFVFSQHCKTSRDAGVTEEKIRAIPGWAVADCGLKSHGMDHGNPLLDGADVWFCSDEHLTFAPKEAVRVGDRIRVVLAHVDPTIAGRCHVHRVGQRVDHPVLHL